MQKDCRPYWVKKTYLTLRSWYVENYLRPHFSSLGDYGTFMGPWYIKVSGDDISLGQCATIVAEADRHVSLGIWGDTPGVGKISIGDYVMISPGVRISAAESITIGDSCMIANGAYITDSDWHGIYDRVSHTEVSKPVSIADNVWIGDHATILKGVTVGENSVVAAGAVVTKDVAANTIVAGNPAIKIKDLDPHAEFKTRADFFSDPIELQRQFDGLDYMVLHGNNFWPWLRGFFWPKYKKRNAD
ncbi:MAG: acyltransferase [Pseudomonadales bacterium]|nr:acyltransferase [Pseudomonadales bacterium]